jgi:hypothetical protein
MKESAVIAYIHKKEDQTWSVRASETLPFVMTDEEKERSFRLDLFAGPFMSNYMATLALIDWFSLRDDFYLKLKPSVDVLV